MKNQKKVWYMDASGSIKDLGMQLPIFNGNQPAYTVLQNGRLSQAI